MSDSVAKRSRRGNRFAWFLMPVLLLMALFAGGFALFGAHASSPLSGRFAFRGVTTSGPETGLYITGQLNMMNTGSSITGSLCGYNLDPSHCMTLDLGNTPDGVHVTFTIHVTAQHQAIQVAGAFVPTLGSLGGFVGTFSSTVPGGATSSGRWEARSFSSTPSLSGVWKIYGLTTTGPNKGATFHAVLTVVDTANNQVTGTYCPQHGTCQNVSGGNHQGYLYMYFFVGSPPSLEFRGSFTADHRANGQFQVPGPGGTLIELGYWLGH
ncbi:MAG TPA: hypothetical protein VNE38_13790 [Ktedonobacteraceae bacterium]|nr:hypothetical protein [Ktedonobacteraceae bacterium]